MSFISFITTCSKQYKVMPDKNEIKAWKENRIPFKSPDEIMVLKYRSGMKLAKVIIHIEALFKRAWDGIIEAFTTKEKEHTSTKKV
jgi:hypothetical protein